MSDDRIRRAIAEAHAGEAVPAFRRLAARPGPASGVSRRGPRVALAFAAALASLAVFLLLPREPEIRDPLAGWVAPTDFLLETPGLEFTSFTPELGTKEES